MLDLEFWKFINTFAPWLSGIGSLCAVIISLCSLYLTLRDRRPRLLIETYLGGSVEKSNDDYICIAITNNGRRVVKIINIYWQAATIILERSFFPKIYPLDDQTIEKLEDSEQIICQFLLKDILTELNGIKLKPVSRRDILRTYVAVQISTGKVFKKKYSREVRNELVKRLKEINKKHISP